MSPTDKERPRLDIDYGQDWHGIAEQYRIAYFKLDRFAIKATFHCYIWRYAAINGWGTVIAMCLLEVFG